MSTEPENGERPMTPQELMANGYPADYHEMRAAGAPADYHKIQPSMEDIAGGDQELFEALKKGAQGRHNHTLLEIWEVQLFDELEGYAGEATLDTYDQFLAHWSWLKYDQVEQTRSNLLTMTRETMDIFDAAIATVLEGTDRTKETVYASFEDDWNDNKEFYIEMIAQWTNLANMWGAVWQGRSMEDKPAFHAATAIAVARILGPSGMVEQMRHLANFDVNDDDQERLSARIEELINGGGDE